MLTETSDYKTLYGNFRWDIPARFNIATACCDRYADGSNRVALIYVDEDGKATRTSFDEMRELSSRFANVLKADGLSRGDRVAVFLSQSLELPIVHLAAFRSGLVSVPLFTLFGEDALEFRLANSGAKAIVTDETGWEKLSKIRDRLPYLQDIYVTSEAVHAGAKSFWSSIETASEQFTTLDTSVDDPAIIIYTSGTTGNPKGALHAHRVLLGHLPNVEMVHDFLPKPGDVMWTPADWAWIGGLFDVLMPAWHHGIPVVAHRFKKFTPEAAFQLLQDFEVRNTFLPPTALKMMRTVDSPEKRWNFRLRSVASGGESLGHELLEWGQRTFGLTINEFYGQTECNMTVSSCADLMPICPGAIGKPVPGHTVAIVDDEGNRLAPGEQGHIAVRAPDPVQFLRYWNNEAATQRKYIGDWLITGDTGTVDPEGYVHFVGRSDDVITSAGYRIGPGEIEDCILQHPAVKMVAVVGAPDAQRTEIVVAVVVLKDGVKGDPALRREIQDHVRTRLAAHEYPREVYFVEELPMTTTGKVIRKELRTLVTRWRENA